MSKNTNARVAYLRKHQGAYSLSHRLLQLSSSHEYLRFTMASACWVLLLYHSALYAPFVYDDLDQIRNNPNLGSLHSVVTRFVLAPATFANQFRGGYGGSFFRPLFWLSLALDYNLWGHDGAGGFHMTNLLLHWMNGLLLFSLLRKVQVPSFTAVIAALLWLGAPINSEVVSWISARAYLLCGFFLLFSLLVAHSYLQNRRRTLLIAYFLGSMGAVLSHEEGLLLLLLVLLLPCPADQESHRSQIPLLGIAAFSDLLFLLLRHIVGAQTAKGLPAFWSVGVMFWQYLGWIVAPIHLSIERSTSTPLNKPSAVAITAWAGLLFVVTICLLVRRRMPLAIAGFAACSVMLLPFLGMVFIYQGMGERYDYLASAGFMLFLAALALEYGKSWQWAAISCVLLWAMWSTWRVKVRVLDWCDPVLLYRNSLTATPNSPFLYDNLGFALREKGDLHTALEAYKQAARLAPSYAKSFTSLGEVYSQLGRPTEAVDAYNQSLTLRPDDAGTVINLAVVLEKLGEDQEAEQQFRRAITLSPMNQSAYLDLGELLFRETLDRHDDRSVEAIGCFKKAIQLNPSDSNAYYDLAVMFQVGGRNDLAVALYRKVLELKPGDPDAIDNLRKMLLR